MVLFELIKQVKQYPVVSVLAAMAIGFVFGLGAYREIFEHAKLDTVARGTVVDRVEIEERQRDLAFCEAAMERRKPLLQECKDIGIPRLTSKIDAELTTNEVRK